MSRAYIGIRGQDVTEELSDKTGIPKGVLISSVTDDSPAMMAGMKEYDVIVKLGEQKVETIKQYHEQLGKHSAGEVVTVTAMRKGAEGYAEMTFDVTLEKSEQRLSEAKAGLDRRGFESFFFGRFPNRCEKNTCILYKNLVELVRHVKKQGKQKTERCVRILF